jgi:exodeoxyribonuclease VII small subunit
MADTSEFSLEKTLVELRQLVEQMQKGVNDFDQQVKLFEQGQTLIKDCRTYLDEAELQVEQLIEGNYQDFPEPEQE